MFAATNTDRRCADILIRFISSVQGRPIGFQDDTLDLELPSTLPLPQRSNEIPPDEALLPYSIAHFEWAKILSDLKYRLYRFRAEGTASELSSMQQDFQSRLDHWLEQSWTMIATLASPEQARLKTKSWIHYYYAMGVVYQPSQACSAPDTASLKKCLDSALARVLLYDELYNQNNLALSWPGTHGILLSSAILIYCLWCSAEVRASVSVAEIAKAGRLCASLLALGGRVWPLAQRGGRSFERLADATIQMLLDPASRPLPTPSSGLAGPNGTGEFAVGTADGSHEWVDIESMLRSFLQNDFDMVNMLDPTDQSACDFGDPMWGPAAL